MIIKNLSISLILVFLVSCNDDNGLFESISESDLLALEGMDEAYDQANYYNDLMEHCIEDGDQCSHDNLLELDRLFHQFDEMFETHHSNYSHNNITDDHHHDNGQDVRHGWMTHGDDGNMGGEDNHGSEPDDHDTEEEGHTYNHDLETLESMMHLREDHELIHPG